MTRSVASLISSMVMASTQQSYGSYGQCGAPPLSGERCNFRWMHQFTQVYTVENGWKWETWETELWMNPEPHHPQYPQMIPDAINIYKYAMITAHHRYHRHWQITAAQWPSCCAEPPGWQTRSSDSPSQHRWSRQFLRVRCPKPMGVWQCVVWSNSDNLW